MGYAHIKNFIYCYFTNSGITDFEFSTAYKKPKKNPNTKLDDVEID